MGTLSRSPRYQQAGVNIEAGSEAVRLFKASVEATHGPEVIGGIGHFGGLFAFPTQAYQEPVLVASTDSVGTKVKVAAAVGRYDTVGQDLVNHCVNDILTLGARPLFFLDYVAVPKLDPQMVRDLVEGAAVACKAANCALIGGETAELPDLYAPGDFDFAGTIVGVVERSAIIDGHAITPSDVVLCLPSNGLQTNGYSLARRIFANEPLEAEVPELSTTLAEALLAVHPCYLAPVQRVLAAVPVKGMAHITGGGLWDNIPRILPRGTQARLHWGTWPVPPIFQYIQQKGDVAFAEMCHVFNMGVGFVLVCGREHVAAARAAEPSLVEIGIIETTESEPRVVIDR
jgi:phosphoribosylformylglycinamidine cyclo-ligase